MTDTEDEKRGLDHGAVDYITKPISPPILLARVRNHLELKRHRDRLATLVAERTMELAETNKRLRAIDDTQRDYLHAISHELRTPMNGVLGIAELALEELGNEKRNEYMEIFERSRNRLLTTVDSALLLAQLQGKGASLATIPVDLVEIVTTAWDFLQKDFCAGDLNIVVPQTKPGLVLGNEELLRQSVTTLLKVALKMATPGTPVVAQFGEDDNRTILRIIFQGPPLPEKLQSTFFDTFSYDRSSSRVQELGLIIPLAAHFVLAMGGTTELRNTASGVEIYLTLRKDTSSTI